MASGSLKTAQNSNKITRESSIEDVCRYLCNNRFSENVINAFKENEVDGFAFLELTESDIFMMLPGKVGPARKLTILLSHMKTSINTIPTPPTTTTTPPTTTPMSLPSLSHDQDDHDDGDHDDGDEDDADMNSIETPPTGTENRLIANIQIVKRKVSSRRAPTTDEESHTQLKNANQEEKRQLWRKSMDDILKFLPDYSTYVLKHLKEGTVQTIWTRFIDETARSVLYIGGLDESAAYNEFGRLMYQRFPCIGTGGEKPWATFNRKLSQKCRHIRWQQKCYKGKETGEGDSDIEAAEEMTDSPARRRGRGQRSNQISNVDQSISSDKMNVSDEDEEDHPGWFPMPKYSGLIKRHLHSGRTVRKVWSRFIEETARHCVSLPSFDKKTDYDKFGEMMYRKFPFIQSNKGQHSWSSFNVELSRKVRSIRFQTNHAKTKPQKTVKKKRRKVKNQETDIHPVDNEGLSDVEMRESRLTMERELRKPGSERDDLQVFSAQIVTCKERRTFIHRLQESGCIRQIVQAHPILSYVTFIEKEFFLLKPDLLSKEFSLRKFVHLLTALDQLTENNYQNCHTDDQSRTVSIIQQVESKLTRAGTYVPSVITVINAPFKEMMLVSAPKDSPRLVFCCPKTTITCGYIVGDAFSMACSTDIKEALIQLLYSYYAWDLSYPKKFQILGLLQVYLLGDAAPFIKGANFVKFTKSLDSHLTEKGSFV